MPEHESLKMPVPLKVALGVVFLQALINGLAGFLIMSEISDADEHGQQMAHQFLAHVAEFVSFIAAVLLVLAALAATTGAEWGRVVLIVLEGITVVSNVFTLISGSGSGALGFVFPIIVIGELSRVRTRKWFAAKASARTHPDTVIG
ncbi:MAG: hypothetical protein AUG49_02650 [Catenulispora sp. 13_1_20CM_3_70_7]|nr:MAG: hypothetical protein AUG49_02650 [Catenulispora sp. 13_1_20CM_3_70_7]